MNLEHALHDLRRLKHRVAHRAHYNHLLDRRKGPSAPRFFKCFDDTRSIFIHIPKAAGVSVAETLYGTRAGRHTTIGQYQIAFPASDFYSYFKFTFVRNPWDRTYSAYRYLMSGAMGGKHDLDWVAANLEGASSFEKFVVDFLPLPNVRQGIHFRSQESHLRSAITGKICVDFIGRFERIQEDFGVISRRLGMEIELPHLNKSNLSGVYRDAYSERMRKIVGEIYELDARIFEYDF
jgi:hypothetical protein